LRSELRRKHHEKEAAQMQITEFAAPDRTWEKLVPLLDDAMIKLNDADRNAILLRYFEKKDLTSVGNALGTSEDAAQKRVSRALEKLRRIFSKRGIVLPSVVLGGTLAAHAIEAGPTPEFGESVVVNCLNKAVVAPGIYALVQESLRQLFWLKLAKAACATSALVAAGFFFAENFPVQAKEKLVVRHFGSANNSIAPKKRIAMRTSVAKVEAVSSINQSFPVFSAEMASLTPVLESAPKVLETNLPIRPAKPITPQALAAAKTAPAQSSKGGSYVFPSLVKTNSVVASNGIVLTPTNEPSKSLPVLNPRSNSKPSANRAKSQRNAPPISNPRNDGSRRVF
jgi:hypothetical protein